MASSGGAWGVLIIDEEGDFTRTLGTYLSDLGLRVLTASHWKEALDRILQDRPDAILINPHLSTVKGETILSFLKQEGKLSPVLVVADRLEEDRIEGLKALGAKGFVQKTDAFYQIAHALSEVLPGFSATDAPIITDEEFERIMIQRLAEVADQGYGTSAPGGPRRGVARASLAGLASLAPLEPERASPPPTGHVSRPSSTEGSPPRRGALPPPPPLAPPERQVRRRGTTRRRRRVGGSGLNRVFLVLFLVCLVVGVLFWFTSQGVKDFVKGGKIPPSQTGGR